MKDHSAGIRSIVLIPMIMIAGLCLQDSVGASDRLKQINLGVILSTQKEDHCFILGALGLSAQKSKDYLSGLGHELAFSDALEPAWPEWDSIRISGVYCHAGVAGAKQLVEMMEDPSAIVACDTLDQLLQNCNCVLLVNTGGTGDDNFAMVSACLKAGHPTFVDKFLAPSLSETRTLLKMARVLDVPLVSSSYIWTSQPGLELKKKLEGKKLTGIVSSGWSPGEITGGIHAIAQMQLLSGDRRPRSVRVEERPDGARACVLFDDGLVGELIPRRDGKIFELEATAGGATYQAVPYEEKHSRPSPINLFSLFFDSVRGNKSQQPEHLKEDAVAIWDATNKAIESGAEVMISDVVGQSSDELFDVGAVEFRTPTVAHPYYHFALRLNLPKAGEVSMHRLEANGQTLRNYTLLAKEDAVDPKLPNNLRRLTIAAAFPSPRPENVYTSPTLIGRLDWQNGASYRLRVELSSSGAPGRRYWAHVRGTAPNAGGYWNADWKHYQSVVVTETAGRDRAAEPVEVTHLFYLDQVTEPRQEFRVLRYDVEQKTHREVPFQVLDFDKVDVAELPMYDEHGKRKPPTYLATGSVTLVFPAQVEANQSSVYLVFYGNATAPAPSYQTDLRVGGEAPGVTVENDVYFFKLHDLNGMLDEVTLKAKPQYKFVHKKETNGAIQWNPDCYAPPRPWAHLSDWEPGKYDYDFEEQRGPVVYHTRRWGMMPTMPELACSMTYRFFAGLPYFTMQSAVHVRFDVAVQALRNAEIVFARESFSEAAWFDPVTKRVETRPITSAPDLTEWVMPLDTPWIAFFDREKGCGYAAIQRLYANGGLNGQIRTLNPYLYVTTGPWIYVTRALLYPYGSRNPQQMVKVLAGSVFLEEWAYLPFQLSDDKDNLFREVESWQNILTNPLSVHIEEPIDQRMQVPEEIYIEPDKTGWEEGKKTE